MKKITLFSIFFEHSIRPRIPTSSKVSLSLHVVKAEVGNCKDTSKMDSVDLNLTIALVVETFGRFVKYSVQENDESPHPDIVQSSGVKRRNAFEILMTSQRSLQCKTLPDPVQEKNKKDKLYNNILSLLELKKLKVEYSEIQRFGDRLVRALCDTLWYIDGHHDVFHQRAIVIPSVFNPFQGYNCPEKTKHRKRQLTNMASDQLHHLASELLTLLQANYWEREYWREFKGDVAGLMQSLVGYTEYLSQKNKKVKHCHVLTTPVRELSSNLRLKFIPASTITRASISGDYN